jgi:hypothetical protein
VASRDISRICEEAVDHEYSWPSFKNWLLAEIKKQDAFFDLMRRDSFSDLP